MQNSTQRLPAGKELILFDGYCNLCNGAVQFVIKRDPREHFFYTSLSSNGAQKLLEEFPEFLEVDSILLYRNGKMFSKSSAALRIAGRLSGLWPVFMIFIIVPPFIRNPIYDFIAKNRYKWFGKRETCMVPDRKVGHLFLDLKS